jgi:hypothetical protein
MKTVKKIGGFYFVVYSFGPSLHSDNNGVFFQSDMIISKPYKTEKGAIKSIAK